MKIPPGYEVISLDVVSLFTNVSNELIYANLQIEKRWPYLYHPIQKRDGLQIVTSNDTYLTLLLFWLTL